MLRPLSLAIGIRYFRSGRRDRFMSLVSWISLLGMMLGVMSLIIVLSVMNGFEAELRQRILSLIPHGYVYGPDQRLSDWEEWRDLVSQQPGVRGSSPWIGGKAMLVSPSGSRGVDLSAIDPDSERGLTRLDQQLVSGEFLVEAGEYHILLGDILARQLRVGPGDSVTVVLPRVTVTPVGVYPRERTFRVRGTYQAGTQLDGSTAFIHLGDGQRLYQLGGDVRGLRVHVDDLFTAPLLMPELAKLLPAGASASDWSQTQGSLFQAVKMEKRMVRLLLFFIVLIAAFNIISILTMAVSEKRSAIAVLRTMGARPVTILAIFIIFGMATGMLGVGLGVLLGVAVALNIGALVRFVEERFGSAVFSPEVYFITDVPSLLVWDDVIVIVAFALLLSLLATLYPAWQASRIQPAEALRYE